VPELKCLCEKLDRQLLVAQVSPGRRDHVSCRSCALLVREGLARRNEAGTQLGVAGYVACSHQLKTLGEA
jgi:hypothetical protein